MRNFPQHNAGLPRRSGYRLISFLIITILLVVLFRLVSPLLMNALLRAGFVQ
jgi:hypothetical protein